MNVKIKQSNRSSDIRLERKNDIEKILKRNSLQREENFKTQISIHAAMCIPFLRAKCDARDKYELSY